MEISYSSLRNESKLSMIRGLFFSSLSTNGAASSSFLNIHEPGVDGEEVPVVQWDLHQYADMFVLKETLPPTIYDMVRQALGLESLAVASIKGQKISQNVRDNLNNE